MSKAPIARLFHPLSEKIIINKKILIYFHRLISILINIKIKIMAMHYNRLFEKYLKKTIELTIRNYHILNLR